MLTTLSILAIAASAPADDSVKFFQGSYKEARENSGAKKLPLFIDFYTDW